MYLLFDIGGTKLRYAVSRDGTTCEDPIIVPTPKKSFEEAHELFLNIAKELPKEGKVQSVIAGVAGPLDKDHTMLVNSPHIQTWINKPLKDELEKVFGAPAYLENDTALVGLGEAMRGAGKGYSIVVYMTISTGVGGARFVDGKIDRNAMGFEPGHQIIDQGKTLEQLVSGTGVQDHYGQDPRTMQDKKIWDEIAKNLAVGLNNIVVHWSPGVVVLGGAMINGNPSIPWNLVEQYYKETVKIFPDPPPLKKGVLGDLGGIYGALELAKQKKFTAT